MSSPTCRSCGASNASGIVYCVSCGAVLPAAGEGASTGSAPSSSMARRLHARVEKDRPAPPSALSRILRLVVYCVWVAVGVIVVLGVMDPHPSRVSSVPIPSARAVVDRILQSSRFSQAGISQALLDSLLSQQESVTFESPVRFLPMPSWEVTHVELRTSGVDVRFSMHVFGWPLRFSESFALKGAPGAWSLMPKSATVGLLDLPEPLVPAVSFLLRPAIMPYYKDLESLSKAGSMALQLGIVEFTTR